MHPGKLLNLVYFTLALVVSSGAWSAELGIAEFEKKNLVVRIATLDAENDPIPVNKLLTLIVTVESGDASQLSLKKFDATMPSHGGHGMVVKPVIVKVAPKLWKIEGVKLHMKGEWKVELAGEFKGQSVVSSFLINI